MPQDIAMVLVGGRGTRLGRITRTKAKPAVTFGGKYKLIDFVLSNLSHASIDTVGIVTQYEPHGLMHYIQRGASWDLDVSVGGVQFLTPYTSHEGDRWQRGTAHAIKQHWHFIEQYRPERVLILSGDHVYKMNYRKLIDHHVASKAAITIGAFKPHDDLRRYGLLSIDGQCRITDFAEKPEHPQSTLASMGIYVFNTDTLEGLLSRLPEEEVDFGKDLIPRALEDNIPMNAYVFDGYFRDVGTVESLFEANMDLLDHPEYLDIHDYVEAPLFTKSQDLPPHHVTASGSAQQSLISDGTLISGHVVHSIIAHRVLVKAFAHVQDSLLYAGVIVGEHAELKNCIVLEDTVILPKTRLVFDTVQVIDNETLWQMGRDVR
ncbi:MAG: glucose-1-phosphate adenylyltransferase [Acholeplasmatales bacterium]|nr:MAG: glucose-1-phosphate adenylyltransferase [Acholeplasmatales bacterium]